MADAIVRLKVESQEYDSKLKRAADQMSSMEQEVRRTGASFAYADKEELAFVQSLGQMGTVATSAKQKMREYTDALTSLTATYRAMSNEEKQSEFGKAMAASIDQIKVKAAELKDIMSDTNREIQNLASDTSFTDGLNLMTSTIGACSAAIVAWTGDSKEMDAVIKDLAKIGTTVAAVDQLTKAFQKQNLVLLKNPYVLAASAVVSLVVALKKLNEALNKETEAEKKNAEAAEQSRKQNEERAKKIAESAAKMMTTYQSLSVEWRRLSTDQQKNDWITKNKSAFEQLGISINNVKDAENAFVRNTAAMVKSFQLRSEAAAYESMGNDAYMRYVQERERLKERLVRAGDEVRVPVSYREDEGLYTYNPASGGYRYTEKGAMQYNVDVIRDSGISELRKEADKYITIFVNLNERASSMLKGAGISEAKPGGTTANVKVKAEIELPEGSLAKLQDDLQKAQENFRMATDDPGREAAKKEIDEITESIKRMTAEEQTAAADGSIASMRQKLQELTGEWENAADPTTRDKLKQQILEVSDALSQMEGKNKTATSALYMWSDHQTKIEETQTLLAQFYEMMNDPNIGEGQRKWAEDMAKSYEEQLKKMIGATDNAVATMQDTLNSLSSGVGAISTIGNALNDLKGIGDDLAEAFSGEMDAWDALMTVFNSGISIMQTVIGVMEAINTLQELGNALSDAKVAKQAAETTAVVTGKTAESTANLAEAGTAMASAGANAASASAAAGNSVASIPYVGPILAVAAIAAVLAAVLSAMTKAESAGKFATGGLIPGSSFSGDNLTANVNSGELILNRAQQDSVAAQLQGSNPMGNISIEGRISGTDILLAASNTNRSRGGSRDYYTKIR